MAFHVTQCPGCDSTFNTNARILQLAQGKVRCGACLTVFEAAEHFISINDADADEDASVFVGDHPSDYFNPSQFITRSALTAPDPVDEPTLAIESEPEPELEPESGFDSLLDARMSGLVAVRDDETLFSLINGPAAETESTPDTFSTADSEVTAAREVAEDSKVTADTLDYGSDEADFHEAVAAELDSEFDDTGYPEKSWQAVVALAAEAPATSLEHAQEFQLLDSHPEADITAACGVESVAAHSETLLHDIPPPDELGAATLQFELGQNGAATQSEQPEAEPWAASLHEFAPADDFQIVGPSSELTLVKTKADKEQPAAVAVDALFQELHPPEDFQFVESPFELASVEAETDREQPAAVTVDALLQELHSPADFQFVESPFELAPVEAEADTEQPAAVTVDALLQELSSPADVEFVESPFELAPVATEADREQPAAVAVDALRQELSPREDFQFLESPIDSAHTETEFAFGQPASEAVAALTQEFTLLEDSPIMESPSNPAQTESVLSSELPAEITAEVVTDELSRLDEYREQAALLELSQPETESSPESLATQTRPDHSPPISAPLAPEEIRLHASFSLYYAAPSPPEPELPDQDLTPIQDSNEEATANVLVEEKVSTQSAALPLLVESAATPLDNTAEDELPIAAEPDAVSTDAPTATLSSTLKSEPLEQISVQAVATEIAASPEPESATSSAIEILSESGQETETEFFHESRSTHEFELIDLDQFDEVDIKLGDGLDWEDAEQESPLADVDNAAAGSSIAADLPPAPITKPAAPALKITTGKPAEQPTQAEPDDSTETIRARAFRAVLEDDEALEALPAESRKAIGRALPPVELISGRERQWGQRIALFFVGVLLAAVLAAQFLWQRLPIFSRTAEWRPVYEFACQFIACELPVYSEISAIRSDNLVVRSHPTTSNALTVSLSFRNTARFPQPFPVVILSFNSATDAVIALREFAPNEYLDIDLRDMTMMPVMSPLQIELNVMDPGDDAVNYTIAFRRP